jgi:hypothetical protein
MADMALPIAIPIVTEVCRRRRRRVSLSLHRPRSAGAINPLKKKALIARPRELIRVSPAMSRRLVALSMLEVRLITTTDHSRQGARSEVHREVPTTYVRDVLPLDRLVAAAWQVLERFAGMATATMCPMTATSSSPSR